MTDDRPSKTQITLEGEGGMGGELYFEHAYGSFAVNLNGELMFLSAENATRLRAYLSARLSPEPRAYVAPIARVKVDDGQIYSATMCAPGLPDGEHDVYPAGVAVPPSEIRSLFNKAVGIQDGTHVRLGFETQEEAIRAFEYLANLGDMPSETKEASEREKEEDYGIWWCKNHNSPHGSEIAVSLCGCKRPNEKTEKLCAAVESAVKKADAYLGDAVRGAGETDASPSTQCPDCGLNRGACMC